MSRYTDSKVYFLASGGRIKVGVSVNIEKRIREIASFCFDEVTLIGTVGGGLPLEREIHRRLRAYRVKGEWFLDCAEVRAVIADAENIKATPIEALSGAAASVIDLLGGTRKVAKELGLRESTVATWKARGRIPSAWFRRIVETAERMSVHGITLDVLLDIYTNSADKVIDRRTREYKNSTSTAH